MEEKKRVVVFDDDKDLLDIYSFIFEEEGWEVHTSQNCDQVLEIVAELSPHLILMDNWIPNIGGMAATQLLKNDPQLQSIPVMYISANNEVAALSKKAGADGFIAKPFDFDQLMELSESLLNKKP